MQTTYYLLANNNTTLMGKLISDKLPLNTGFNPVTWDELLSGWFNVNKIFDTNIYHLMEIMADTCRTFIPSPEWILN